MATIVNSDIRATGGDFATITLWESSLGDIVAADEQHNGLLFDEVYDEQVTFSGTTSDATRFPQLMPADGEQNVVRVEGSGPRIVNTGNGILQVINILDSFVVIRDFEVTSIGTGAGGSSVGIIRMDGVSGTVRGMFIHDTPDANPRGIGIISGAAGPDIVIDNFLYDFNIGSGRVMSLFSGVPGASFVNNNTAINSADRGIGVEVDGAGATVECKNNVVLDCVGDDFRYTATGGASVTTDKNMSSDATADDNGDGTHFISVTSADIVVDLTPGSEDLHLKTGTDAIGNGVDLETAPVGIEFDIDGYDRDLGEDAWDLGADQQGKDSDDNNGGPPGPSDVLVEPTGSTLDEIASDTVTLDLDNEGEEFTPIGSTLQTLASGVPVIDIPADESVSPTGNTLGTLADNNTVDLRHPLTITIDDGGSTLLPMGSGIPTYAGTAADLDMEVISDPETDSLFPLRSGVPTLLTVNVGDASVAPFGSTLQPIASEEDLSLSIIDTDIDLDTVLGSLLGTVVSGVPAIMIMPTGVTTIPLGSGLLILASGVPKISRSFPTAPPGTAGGRLIIRSITRNVTRPVVHETDLEVRVFNA